MEEKKLTFEEMIDLMKEHLKNNSESYNYEFTKEALERLVKGIEELQKPSNIEFLLDYMINLEIEHNYGEVPTMKIETTLPFDINVTSYESFKEMLKAPYQEPKIRLSQFEYDSLSCCDENKRKKKFSHFTMLKQMKHKGYYKGVYDVSMTVEEILNNCEVVNEAI